MSLFRSKLQLTRIITVLVMIFLWIGVVEAVTLSFKPQVLEREIVDEGLPGASLGDLIVGNGTIFNKIGEQVGTFQYSHIVTDQNADAEVRWVSATYAFGDDLDSITIQGSVKFLKDNGLTVQGKKIYYAVTGGTGKYAGARGACQVARVDDDDYVTTRKFLALNIKFR